MTAYRGLEGQERGRVSDSSLRPEGQGADTEGPRWRDSPAAGTEGGERPDRGGGGAGRKDGKRRDGADAEGRKKKETPQLHAAGSP